MNHVLSTLFSALLAASIPSAFGQEALKWDSTLKEVSGQPGQTNLTFEFRFTNAWPDAVAIEAVRPSCHCTVLDLPLLPWRLEPGTSHRLLVSVDLRGKRGVLRKAILLETTRGSCRLEFAITLPEQLGAARDQNVQIARADRQAVFRGDCAACHAEPARGKQGRALYAAVCAICHDASHRASMVPDLRAAMATREPAYWRQWIKQGKPGSLMPAFAASEGGPLDDDQIDSLVAFLGARRISTPVARPSLPPLPSTP